MPAYINDTLKAINSNSIGCSFISENLLEAIGAMAEHHCYSKLLAMFH
jgi:hypothetical protein